MVKPKFYLFLAIGFLAIAIGNFCLDGLSSPPRILLNIGWLVIAGFYFLQYLKNRKTT